MEQQQQQQRAGKRARPEDSTGAGGVGGVGGGAPRPRPTRWDASSRLPPTALAVLPLAPPPGEVAPVGLRSPTGDPDVDELAALEAAAVAPLVTLLAFQRLTLQGRRRLHS
jgi:hypothetical protein